MFFSYAILRSRQQPTCSFGHQQQQTTNKPFISLQSVQINFVVVLFFPRQTVDQSFNFAFDLCSNLSSIQGLPSKNWQA